MNASPVGAGPFKVTELVAGSHVYFEKNPDYWDAENIKIDRVELSFGIDASTVVSSLQTGVYDFAGLAPSQIEAAKEAGLDVVYQPGFNASNISINVNKAPFNDPVVLLATRHAINRQEFVDKVTFGNGTTTAQPFPSGYIAYDDAVGGPVAVRPGEGQADPGRGRLHRERSPADRRLRRLGDIVVNGQRDRAGAARGHRHHREHQGRHELGHSVLRQGPGAVDCTARPVVSRRCRR